MFASRTDWKRTPNRLAAALERHQRSGKKLLDLTVSNPTQVGLKFDEAGICNSLSRPEVVCYTPQAKGLITAREAVSEYYRSRGDAAPHPERIFLTSSTSEGYSFIFRLLCQPGDEVLVPAPSYPLFEYLASVQDVHPVGYHLIYDHGWHIDLHSLEKAITRRTRAIIAVHPNNPTGSYVSDLARQALNEICWQRQLALIVDEVFLDYQLSGHPRRSFVSNNEVLTFTLSGLSKICALPQMKLAWLVVSAPADLADEASARLEIIADTYLSVNTPVQIAAPALLEQRAAIQGQLSTRMHRNLAELDTRLAGQSACTRLEIEGGWYAVLRVPVTGSDEELALALVERRSVLTHPGHFFDFQQEGHLVVSLIALPEEFAEGIAAILRA
jgi:alanine-synthesizing transaminase